MSIRQIDKILIVACLLDSFAAHTHCSSLVNWSSVIKPIIVISSLNDLRSMMGNIDQEWVNSKSGNGGSKANKSGNVGSNVNKNGDKVN